MPRPLAWTRLRNEGSVVVSPRSGHTLTATSVGFVLYGGMDGRRNDLGNPAPNSDLFVLKLGPKGTFEWNGVEIDAGSQTPPVRTLHTAVAVSSDELFVFGGIHSTTPYQALNDGWTLDTTGFEWRRCQFKTAKAEHKGSYLRRMTGKIPEYLMQMPSNSLPSQPRNNSASKKPKQRAASVTFESLALAASRAVTDRALTGGGAQAVKNSMRGTMGITNSTTSPTTSWGRKAWKKILTSKRGSVAPGAGSPGDSVSPGVTAASKAREMKMRQKKAQGPSLMTSEEEQFHDDILRMVTMGSTQHAEAGSDPQQAAELAQLPAPRANHSTALFENTLVLFGGHGGLGFQRRAFNDVWTLNLDNNRWVELTCRGTPPAPRSGHASFEKEGSIYIFGGWNSETQFNDLFMLDVENKDWMDLDLQWSVPRWNMAVQLVEAIPSWRVFIFGGSADSVGGRSMGAYDRNVGVLDLGEELRWDAPALEERPKDERPLPREHTAICYDAEEGRLVIFGGWSNKWLDDCWQINVSSIVGPPYAIAAVRPPLGPVSGLQKIQVVGIGFKSTPGAVVVRFIAAGGRHVSETQGTVISDELIECTTPNVVGSIGPRECEVRVQIGIRDFTTTVANYHYFLNTVAGRSLCYGPGLLDDQQAGHVTRFMIQARNELGENRKSGRDEWVVQVHQVLQSPGADREAPRATIAAAKEHRDPLPIEIEDLDNGQYEVRYVGEVGDVIVHVSLVDEHGKQRPVRGSPFKSTHIQYAKTSANEYLGSSVHVWLTSTLKRLEDFNRSTELGLNARPKDDDVKGLIKVMNHIQELEVDEDNLVRKQDEIFETLAHLERGGLPIDKQQKTLNKIRNNLEHLKDLSHKVSASIANMVQTQKEVYRSRIATFEAELRAYQGGLRREAYYVYRSGVELAQSKLRSVEDELDRKRAELEDLLHIATNFEYPEELVRSQAVLQQMRDEVAIVRALWEYEIGRIKMTEGFLVKRWHEVRADEMEDDIKASQKKLRETKIDKKLDVFLGMQSVVKDWTVFCPLVADLTHPSMRPRHWAALMAICGRTVQVHSGMLLRDVWNLELHKLSAEVQDLGEQAKQEEQMEAKLSKLDKIWSGVEFEMEPHRGSDISLLTVTEDNVDQLEENQVEVQNMFALRFLATFETEVVSWQRTLASITEVSSLLSEVQRTWAFLENLFIYSEEVKKELPEDSDNFVNVDHDVKQLLRRGAEVRLVRPFCCEPGIFEALEKAQAQLQVCEKALNEFMDGKRRAFPRFFFMSAADLLDVLSNGNSPARVVPLFPKFFNAIEKYDLAYPMEEEAVEAAKRRLGESIADVNVDVKKMRVDLTSKISFASGLSQFANAKAARNMLDQVASVVVAANEFLAERGQAIFHLRIAGHTHDANQDLSFARARAVREAISAKAVELDPKLRSVVDKLFVAEGYSDDRPLPGLDRGHKENSRIEIQVLAEGGQEGRRGVATGMHACIGKEFVPFPQPLPLVGKVEVYLERCIDAFRGALRHFTKEDLAAYYARRCEADGAARGQWLLGVKAAQCGLLVQLITWVQLVETAFARDGVPEGSDPVPLVERACLDAWERQKELLLKLIALTMTDLTKPDRQKLMCAITLDAHNRDVQERLVTEKVVRPDAFQWQSMLKSYWEDEGSNARMCICDATLEYAYEYLGNGGRLVVTPLTDRIYVTATQALHLCMGCAPAGPAGTGKTESTKDLANALARACYVINAAPEMDYVTLGNIFKGLAASGSWGCFDEFNRLVPEVLSVCTVQFKAVCDALKKQAKRFLIQGDEMSLDTGVGVFITMNPGYLGRSELPEGLKALFRPITVMVPDFMLIMENMFMGEGFLSAKELALKFATLYALNKDLLSKSNKYDWGMRAIKSVLVVAGGFKRAEPGLQEAAVLMRSLRDTNVAKIQGDDLKIFMGLLADLFPGIDVPRARDLDFERVVKETMEEDFNYTSDDQGYLLLKITQLVELLAIRHSVFLMGGPGSFKSAMWKVLRNAKTRIGEKTTVVDFSPKAITTNELYGSVNMATREWKDGILSKTMRDLGLIPDTLPKWILLDGDLDANWIESMNSVMDDSRLLTLPSNERIPLKPHMKMIFEIRDLNYATPATATRAGIVCMSDTEGVQWRSYVSSWIRKVLRGLPARQPAQQEWSGTPTRRGTPAAHDQDADTADLRDSLEKLFEKYCPVTLKWVSTSAKIQVPMVDLAFISVLCSLLEPLLCAHGTEGTLQTLETWFVFCVVYAIGGCLAEIDGTDYRKQFSNWWKNEMKTVKYPSNGLVFDYFVRDGRLEDWTNMPELRERAEYDASMPMGEVTVPTSETVAAGYFMKALIKVHHPVMLIGLAGCGKTQSCAGMLQQLCQPTQEGKQFTFHKMNMSYYTDSTLLQTMMEIPLEKKTGKRFAPPGKLHLIYFIDDLNMPALDKYNTQSAIELIKQKQDYDHWYDRNKIQLKEIINTQYLCCMNPTAGSFGINPRLQRHFWTCAVPFPKQSALSLIYSTFIEGHMKSLPFKVQVQELASAVIKAALTLHSTVSSAFRKTAKNMHYEFNIRHMSGVFAGLLQAQPKEFADAEKFVLLWIHESERIYGDRLVSVADLKRYRALVGELAKKMFGKFNFSRYFQEKNPEPLVFAPFARGLKEMETDGPRYDKIKDMDRLSEILSEAMCEYDASNAAMDLVLFEDAMKHVAKICRIISRPSGHPLLVGVGGSGRQSLSRLSAFVCQCITTMIVISSTYGLYELKLDLQRMYKKAGEKDEGVVFLFTDNQIANERFLVFFNDLLASGEITDLYPNEDKDAIRNVVRSACKAEGITDTPDNLWNFYLSRVRKNLHMALCFSPVGDGMWSRARKFPALVNCTVIDWFQPWPVDALRDVAAKFLEPMEQLGPPGDPLRQGCIDFFPFSFEAVNELSQAFIQQERRYAYTTPKSFLELIKLYTLMLERKVGELSDKKSRLSAGLVKLFDTSKQVSKLEEELNEKAVVVKEKMQKTSEVAEEVALEEAKVRSEAQKASLEAATCDAISKQVQAKKEECTAELAKALPLVEEAKEALEVLDKKEFQELKNFKNPPRGVDTVSFCVMHLMAGIDPNIDVDKKGKIKEVSWKSVQKMLIDPTKFLANLKGFQVHIDNMAVPPSNVDEARRLKDGLGDEFSVEVMKNKSQAAAGLCAWVINIIKYYDVVVDTDPKKKQLQEAEASLEQANQRKEEKQQLVNSLQVKLDALVAEFQKATAEKDAVMAEAERCQTKLGMANRLINALSANGEIWKLTVEKTDEDLVYIPGDSVVACSFASYLGVFTREYRERGTAKFIEFLTEHQVPLGPQPDPLNGLSTEADRARWCTRGLPSDRFSLENGAIMTNSERWCLMVDPQAQGVVWVKQKEADRGLAVTRMGHSKMVHTFEAAIQGGHSVLIENMGEQVDAVLQPVIARNYIKRGGRLLLKIGDKEVVSNPEFRLFMQTKLSNPHYQPEVQAECTVINFTVTETGLEEQLLFLVVKLERPDLARQKSDVIQQQNEFKVRLAELEAHLLEKLSSAEGDILEDVELIQSLEDAKATSDEVKEKVAFAQDLETRINVTSESYRDAAARGALLFFLMMDLGKMHSFYKYSLDAFVMVVSRAVHSVKIKKPDVPPPKTVQLEDLDPDLKASNEEEDAEADEYGNEGKAEEEEEFIVELLGAELLQRVVLLKQVVTMFVFNFLRRGLLDADKLTVASMLALRVLVRSGDVQPDELGLLIRAPLDPTPSVMPESMRSWLTETQWAQLKCLEQLPTFRTTSSSLTHSIEQDSLGWKRWFAEERAEAVDLPRGCRDIGNFHRLFLLRVLRPDRIGAALHQFVVDNLGNDYVEQAPFSMAQTYEESSRLTPIFFVLFPGTDPTSMVEAQAAEIGLTEANGKLVNISMGQGQEKVAIASLHQVSREGGWVMLQNVHLMQAWLRTLERNLELLEEFSHPDFRCILTSEPPSALQGPMWEVIPESILQKCIKIADEAPTDLKSNLRRAWTKFGQSHIDACVKQKEFKATLFALCFFHSLILGRIKFGAQGWSKKYPFNDGDLAICGQVLCNYLNNADRQQVEVPWPDIRYIFGEIMYGGHITDFWDRRVNNTYLEMLITAELLATPPLQLCKGFRSPDPAKSEYSTYAKVIEDKFPQEAPELFSLHPNAEIGYLTNQGFSIFKTVQGISGSDAGAVAMDISASKDILTQYLEELPTDLDMMEIRSRLRDEDYTPYVIASLQESDRMNLLLQRIRGSLQELELGIGGQLNVTEGMEKLADALQLNRVAEMWRELAYPSLKPLGMWFADLLKRADQLVHWTGAQNGLLLSTWISGLFNPMAFLTAVMQVTARDRAMPLDFMTNRVTFLNIMDPADYLGAPATGVYVHGLFLEGASWEEGKGDEEGYITASKMKELHTQMPVVNVFSVLGEEMSWEGMYRCPVFMTAERGATYVTMVNVHMDRDDDERVWVLAGAALVLTDDGR